MSVHKSSPKQCTCIVMTVMIGLQFTFKCSFHAIAKCVNIYAYDIDNLEFYVIICNVLIQGLSVCSIET